MPWVSVHAGPLWEVMLYRSRLEAEGLTTFVPDEAMGAMAPVNGPFQAEIHVPSTEQDAAHEILVKLKEEAPPPPSPYYDQVFGEVSEDEAPAVSKRTDRLSRWTIGLGMLGVTAPLALIVGFFYLRAARREEHQVPNHSLAIVAMVFGIVTTVGASIALFSRNMY